MPGVLYGEPSGSHRFLCILLSFAMALDLVAALPDRPCLARPDFVHPSCDLMDRADCSFRGSIPWLLTRCLRFPIRLLYTGKARFRPAAWTGFAGRVGLRLPQGCFDWFQMSSSNHRLIPVATPVESPH